MSAKEKNHEVTFIMGPHLGVLATAPNGWKKELNMVAWNGGSEKFDLREWDPEHKSMSRGITLNKEEFKRLAELVKDLKL